jgi:hypothetical protein
VAGMNEVLRIKVGGIHAYHQVIVTGIRLEGLTKEKNVFIKTVSKNVALKTGLLESVSQIYCLCQLTWWNVVSPFE